MKSHRKHQTTDDGDDKTPFLVRPCSSFNNDDNDDKPHSETNKRRQQHHGPSSDDAPTTPHQSADGGRLIDSSSLPYPSTQSASLSSTGNHDALPTNNNNIKNATTVARKIQRNNIMKEFGAKEAMPTQMMMGVAVITTTTEPTTTATAKTTIIETTLDESTKENNDKALSLAATEEEYDMENNTSNQISSEEGEEVMMPSVVPGAERVPGVFASSSHDVGNNRMESTTTVPSGSSGVLFVAQAQAVKDPIVADTVDVDQLAALKDENEVVTRKNKIWMIVVLILVILLGIVGIVLGVVLSAGDGGETPTVTITDPTTTTESPSLMPSQAPSVSSDTIWTTLIEQSANLDPDSPQRRAVDWLTADPYTTSAVVNDTMRILQRFGLAVFWYSTGGDTTWDNGWLRSSTECGWGLVGTGGADISCDTSTNEVERLQLTETGLSGTLPTEIALLTSLTRMDLSSNKLKGTIPSEIGALTSLTFLWLSGNQFSGTIVTEVGLLTALSSLYSFGNALTGRVPTELGNLTHLQALSLHSNGVTGSIPSSLCSPPPPFDWPASGLIIDCGEVACNCCTDGRGTPC